MSSSDDPFDKELRKHFRDVFDDFERQPSASLKERIWQQLAKPVLASRQYGLLLLGLFIGMGFFYHKYDSKLHSYQLKVDEGEKVNAQQLIAPDLQASTKEPQPVQSSHQLAETSSPIAKTNALAYERKTTKSSLSVNRPVEPLVHEMLASRNWLPSDNQKSEPDEIQKRRSFSIETRSLVPLTTNTFDAQVGQPAHSETELSTLRTETPEIHLSTPSIQPKTIEEVDASVSVSWQLLQSLPLHTVGNLPEHINRRVDVQVPAVSESQSIKPKTPVRWLASVTPLSTYQLMTVVDKPNTYVQRVDAPAAFSGPTWGYQLRAGIEWRQYEVDLSFGQIRRWAYYDLATNTFQVQPVGGNKYEVTRLEQPVAENVSLSMLGASLNKQYKLGGVQSRYVARLGGAISYIPDSRQSLLWAKAMVGATFPLAKAYQLQVGPTVEYGFSRIWSTERQLIIRPYLVGAELTIRPNKP